MIDVQQWDWKLNLADMTCSNGENNVVVKIYTEGNWARGRLLDISMELLNKIAERNDGPKIIEEIVLAAENEYYKTVLPDRRIEDPLFDTRFGWFG